MLCSNKRMKKQLEAAVEVVEVLPLYKLHKYKNCNKYLNTGNKLRFCFLTHKFHRGLQQQLRWSHKMFRSITLQNIYYHKVLSEKEMCKDYKGLLCCCYHSSNFHH